MKKLLLILLPITFFLVSCEGESEPQLSIGDEYGGGIIFWLDASGEHGLIAAKSDWSKRTWGCEDDYISGADGLGIGTGNQNTLDIVSECLETNSAAQVCFNSSQAGYTDWYLPSIYELKAMYDNLHLQGIGNFMASTNPEQCFFGTYWSSSEAEDYSPNSTSKYAYSMCFSSGDIYPISNVNSWFAVKGDQHYIRAIRSF